jgi:hypothetical protein
VPWVSLPGRIQLPCCRKSKSLTDQLRSGDLALSPTIGDSIGYRRSFLLGACEMDSCASSQPSDLEAHWLDLGRYVRELQNNKLRSGLRGMSAQRFVRQNDLDSPERYAWIRVAMT